MKYSGIHIGTVKLKDLDIGPSIPDGEGGREGERKKTERDRERQRQRQRQRHK